MKKPRRTFVEIGFSQVEIKKLKAEADRRTMSLVEFIGDMAMEGLRVENIRAKGWKPPKPKPRAVRYSGYSDDPEDMCAGERLANGHR